MDRGTWAIAGGALALVVLGLLAVTVLQRPLTPTDLRRPEGVVRAYIEATDGGHPERAWDLLAKSARKDVNRDDFIRDATLIRHSDSSRVAIESTEIEGNTARVELSRTYAGGDRLFGPSSYTNRITVRLEREDGEWRITVPPEPHLISKRFVAPPAAPQPGPPGQPGQPSSTAGTTPATTATVTATSATATAAR